MKHSVFIGVLGFCLFISCGGTPQDDWIGTWQDIDDPDFMYTFTRDGIMLIELHEGGVRTAAETAKYTVDEATYTLTALDNDFNRNAGIAHDKRVSGDWKLSRGRLTLYVDTGIFMRLRRAN